MKRFIQVIPYLVLILVLGQGCRMSYSFTGASISPDIKTVAVQYFDNRAPIINPSLSPDFVEALKDRFISQTSLQLVDNAGDLNFEGSITGYRISPMAIQSNETAALNRLTVSIKVKFTNEKDPEKDFDTSFSAYADYDSAKSLDAVEAELLKGIIDQLTEDIFNKAVVNW